MEAEEIEKTRAKRLGSGWAQVLKELGQHISPYYICYIHLGTPARISDERRCGAQRTLSLYTSDIHFIQHLMIEIYFDIICLLKFKPQDFTTQLSS
eukprot:gene9022-6326_t